MESINQRVKELRLALEMNQKTFGEQIGVAQAYLSQIEKGDRDVTDKIFRIICLENWNGKTVREEWLRSGKKPMFTNPTKDEQITAMLADIQSMDESNFKYRLVAALSKLDSDGWDNLEKLIDMISEDK